MIASWINNAQAVTIFLGIIACAIILFWPLLKSNFLYGLIGAALFTGGIGAVYLHLGAPHQTDRPLAKRLNEAELIWAHRPNQDAYVAAHAPPPLPPPDPEYAAQLAALRDAAWENADPIAMSLLIDHEAALGHYADALRALDAMPESGMNHDIKRLKILLAQAGGYVSPQSEALARAILADTRSAPAPIGIYALAQAYFQTGRPDIALAIAQEIPPDSELAPQVALLWEEAARDLGTQANREDSLFLPTLAHPPKTVEAAQAMIAVLALIGQKDAAHAIYRERHEEDPEGFAHVMRQAGLLP